MRMRWFWLPINTKNETLWYAKCVYLSWFSDYHSLYYHYCINVLPCNSDQCNYLFLHLFFCHDICDRNRKKNRSDASQNSNLKWHAVKIVYIYVFVCFTVLLLKVIHSLAGIFISMKRNWRHRFFVSKTRIRKKNHTQHRANTPIDPYTINHLAFVISHVYNMTYGPNNKIKYSNIYARMWRSVCPKPH